MFLKIYLDEHDREKLRLFTHLSENSLEYFSTSSLLKEVSFSYNKIKNLLLEINLDLVKLYQHSIFTENGQIYFQKSRFDLGQYQTFLLRHSTSYQFLLALLKYPQDTLTDYCEHHHISRSTIHRKLDPVRRYLNTLGIRLMLDKMVLIGSEAAVRAFYLQILWLSDGQDDLLKMAEIAEILTPLKCWTEPWGNQINYQQGRLALAIAYLRIKATQFVAANDRCANYLFPTYHPAIQNFFTKICPDDITAQAELCYFYYARFYQPIYLSTADQRLPLVRQNLKHLEFIKHLPLSLINGVKHMLKDDLPAQEFELFRLNFYNLFANAQLWQTVPAPLVLRNTMTTSHRNQQLLIKIQRQLTNMLRQLVRQKKTSWLSNNLDTIALCCAQLILPYVKPEISTNLVSVGLQDDPDSFLIQDVLRFCTNIPFINIELFNSNEVNNYDFIITNHSQTTTNLQVPQFTLKNGHFSYTSLLAALEQNYHLKND
ncbi:hypothetical protein FC84_GL000745 [Lapidilactobacillus dextrinicus DSM 20335]|uniref:Mga helix-turn-helix domain-containing protein n=1 Tax=Lapidilactobacillus dextrinicus DSM 20335 TaxID=1423738 RepID=A0A0R2BGE0_9LACO|nr:helix-turn-helix domain-containing protein [Lapidilactobacillus dextrinicus]KRM78488.1 hypothetical protein FC84_GL000745 [Lapidilactobacillus dextrinicus DSM 20335]QFG46184.1 hypothetical protein LH506_01355 [Lapidilactobacillus dextrinicus]